MLSSLIVPIDADLGGLRKGLRDAQAVIKRSTADLGALGASMSRAITLPLLAIGAGAIKASADLQQLTTALTTTMQGAGYSIEAATKEMEALREAAKAPGLDFEQAIKGSVRLQNVGYSAAKARDILVELANAISTSGGTATELDSVTRQFAQMSAKGRILQEDLTIIVENMPVLSRIMQETFGTASAEGLRKLGISADEFIQGVTEGMKTLPRVTGGLANDIVNAFNAIKLAAAEIGTVLNERLRIGERLGDFANFVSGLADGFKAMSPEAQTAVLGIAAFAAALGPAIKLSSMLISGIGGVATGIAQMRIFLVEAIAGTKGMTAAQILLNNVMKANVLGAVIGVALALAAAYAVLRKDTSDAAQAQRQLQIVETMASNTVAEQMTRVNILTNTLKSNVASLDAKKRALAELNQIAPEYFGKVKMGAGVVDQATVAQNAYRESLMKTARVQAATEQLMGLEKELNTLAQNSSASTMQTLVNVLKSGGSTTQFFSEQAQTLGDNFKKSKTTIEAQKTALLDLITANEANVVSTKKAIVTGGGLTKTKAELAAETKAAADAVKQENDSWESQIKMLGEIEAAWTAQANAEAAAVEARAGQPNAGDTSAPIGSQALTLGQNMGAAMSAISTPLVTLTGQVESFAGVWMTTIETALTPAQQIMANLQAGVTGFGESWRLTSELITASGSIMQQTVMAMGDAIGQAAQSGATSLRELAGAALKSARDIIGAWIRQGVAAAISKALSSIPFPFNIAAGAVAGGLAQAAFNKVLSFTKIPGFAMGTDFAPGGMAVVGELGPELVNLPRGSQVIPNNRIGNGGGGMHITGTLVARGADLVYVFEEETRKQRRKR